MKTKEELKALKTEVDSLKKKLAELSEDELEEVIGGTAGFRLENQDAPGKDVVLQTYKKDIGSDKNAKVIF